MSAGGAWPEPVDLCAPQCLIYSMAHWSIQEIVALLLERKPRTYRVGTERRLARPGIRGGLRKAALETLMAYLRFAFSLE